MSTFSAGPFKLYDLYRVACQRLEKSRASHAVIRVKPVIDVDASWVARSIRTQGGGSHAVIGIASIFAKSGFDVNIVCDAPIRHHSKRVTSKREADHHRKRINYYWKKGELIDLQRKLQLPTTTQEEAGNFREDIRKKSAEVTKLESALTHIDVGEGFYQELKDLAPNENSSLNGKITIDRADFQADTKIAFRCIHHESDIVLASDSDLAALAGQRCLAIKQGYKFNIKKGEFHNATIFSGFEGTIDEVLIHSPAGGATKAGAKYPLWDKQDDPKIRAIVAVGVGCDVFDGGVHGVGPSQMAKILEKTKNSYDELMDELVAAHIKTARIKKFANSNASVEPEEVKSMLECFAEAFLNEPISTNQNEIKYLYGEPVEFPKYIEAFALGSWCKMIDGPPIAICHGPGSGQHRLLAYEGLATCTVCQKVEMCKSCSFVLPHNNDYACVDCHAAELAVPLATLRTAKLTNEIEKELQEEFGFQMKKNEFDAAEIQDMYEALMEKPLYSKAELTTKVAYPLKATNFLQSLENVSEEKFALLDGGRFVRARNLTPTNIASLVALLAELVTYDGVPSNRKPHPVYTVVSKYMIECAENSRLYGGFRLLKRSIRHGMDPATPSILEAKLSLFNFEGEIGIFLEHAIKASMKDVTYGTKVAFSKAGIVACACQCKAGSCNKERIVCVHIPSVIYELQLLLHDALAEHLLCEIASLWEVDWDDRLSDSMRITFIKGITKLRQAADAKYCPKFGESLTTLPSMALKDFTVGTSNFKPTPAPPNQSELGPIRDVSSKSTIALAAAKIKQDEADDGEKNCHYHQLRSGIEQYEVDYCKIVRTNAIIKRAMGERNDNGYEECIGFKLCESRNESETNPENVSTVLLSKLKKGLDIADSDERPTTRVTQTAPRPATTLTEMDEEATHPLRESTTRARIGQRRYCNAVYCSTICSIGAERFRNVPSIPPELTATASKKRRRTHARKSMRRRLWLSRMGLSPFDRRAKLLICTSCHLFEKSLELVKYRKYEGGPLVSEEEWMELPLPEGQSEAKTRMEYATRQPYPVPKEKQMNVSAHPSPQSSRQQPIKVYASRRTCVYPGCNSTHLQDNISFHRVPPAPNPTLRNGTSKDRKSYAMRLFHRNECMRRLGISLADPRKEIRFCSEHPVVKVSKSFSWNDKDGIQRRGVAIFDTICAYSHKSTLNATSVGTSKGVGVDRMTIRFIESMQMEQDSPEMALVQTLETSEGALEQMNGSIRKSANLEAHLEAAKLEGRRDKRLRSPVQTTDSKRRKRSCRVVKKPKELREWIVKCETGFTSVTHLLSYVSIICNGDISKILAPTTNLTWFEEWYLFFELLWGRTLTRWCDAEGKYDVHRHTLRTDVFDVKLIMLMSTRASWPLYASLEEDEKLRDTQRWKDYDGKRCIQWDSTNLHIPKSSRAENQRRTWSCYYAENCAKGGIGLQLCGWILTAELFEGATTDDNHFKRSGILEQQEEFVRNQLDTDVPFENTLDKGYRVRHAAWMKGKQTISQPFFAKSDEKFNRHQTLRSAAVASDRGANERAVRLSKMSGFLKAGIRQNASVDRFADVWLAWSFQTNFMFKPVL